MVGCLSYMLRDWSPIGAAYGHSLLVAVGNRLLIGRAAQARLS
jgi:hypothetical protein